MVVTIEFFGTQRSIAGSDSTIMQIKGQATGADALNHIKATYPDLQLNENVMLAAVNHHIVSLGTILKADDRVCFVPAIGGG